MQVAKPRFIGIHDDPDWGLHQLPMIFQALLEWREYGTSIMGIDDGMIGSV